MLILILKICKIRTWQSMKERYMKHIKYDLTAENYKLKFLSKSDMTLLRKGFVLIYVFYSNFFNIEYFIINLTSSLKY